MQTAKINIKDKNFSAVVVDTEESRQIGLSNTDHLPSGKGMLFVFDGPQDVTMNMVSMAFPLDMIFIDADDTVIAVRQLSPGRYDTSVDNVAYVLEVNAGEGSNLVGEKVIIEETSKGVIGAARKGAKLNLIKIFRQGGLFINRR